MGYRPFKCRYKNCEKSFVTLGNLKSHEFNHCLEKPYKCTYKGCHNQYSKECRLNIHIRTHVNKYNYNYDFINFLISK